MTAEIRTLSDYSRSRLPSGQETPRSALRGLRDGVRPFDSAEIVALRRDRGEPVQLPADCGDGDAA